MTKQRENAEKVYKSSHTYISEKSTNKKHSLRQHYSRTLVHSSPNHINNPHKIYPKTTIF